MLSVNVIFDDPLLGILEVVGVFALIWFIGWWSRS
jgi:hypothetical protein